VSARLFALLAAWGRPRAAAYSIPSVEIARLLWHPRAGR
jgi:hypothetical protein